MPEKSHWPFGSETRAVGSWASHLPQEQASERARVAEQAAMRQRMRHDRLIIGGRAHAKKHGLS